MRKHKLVVLIISIVGVCLPMTFSYFNNYQLNNRHILLSNTGKIDICGDQIFNCDGALTYTQSVALFDAPSKTDILSFLLSHVVNHQYDNVINDLLVPNYDQKATSVTITTKQYSQMYLGQIVVNWTFNQLVDLSTVITNTNLYSDPDTAVWQTVPNNTQIIERALSLNSSLQANQVKCDNHNVVFTPSSNPSEDPRGTYSVTISAIDGSNVYSGSQTVSFKLKQRWITLLGLTFLFATDDDQNTDPILDEQNQTIISLRRGGEYNITSTDDSSTARGFKLLDGTADSEIDAKINIIGNAITLQPTSAAAITLGEYNNVEFNVTASTTSFQGYGSYSISYPGVRVPYSSTFKVSGSTMLTASGGNNQVACAIGGITQDGSSDQLAKSCGTIIFDGNISATLTSGKNSEDGRINGSAVIGGAGCSVSSNKAGDCKGVVINTTGTIVCNQPSGSNFRYGQGPVIGGGGFGKRTNQWGSGGDLDNFEMHQGKLILNRTGGSNAISNPTVLGGGTVTSDGGEITGISTGGDLKKFILTGGSLIINCPYEFANYSNNNNSKQERSLYETTIGGGDILTTRGGTDGLQNAKLGSLGSFYMSGGNIVMYGVNCDRQYGNMIGAGTLCDGTIAEHTITITEGTVDTFNITGGLMLMTGGVTSTYHFYQPPTDASNRNLYPVYVPKEISGFDTVGQTVVIPSLNYFASLNDWSTYDNFDQYTGVLWLPEGNITDIQIGSNLYHCNVSDKTFEAAKNVVSLA